MKKKATPKC
jgi:hypothetical protein